MSKCAGSAMLNHTNSASCYKAIRRHAKCGAHCPQANDATSYYLSRKLGNPRHERVVQEGFLVVENSG
jgi:hypothetical protein